jgi:phenylacetate-CoA ligase
MAYEQKYFNPDVEPFLNTPQMREVQWEKLKHAVRYAFDKVPFDRERMDAAGVKPDDIHSLEDYGRAFAPIRQADFRTVFERFDNDMEKSLLHLFGRERMEDLHFISTTSGTTGVPTPYPFFHRTLPMATEIFGRVGWRAGFVPGTRLALCFGLSLHVAGIPQVFWFSRLRGVTVLPIGAEAGTERILNMMKLFQANALTCTPSLATYLIEKSPEVLGRPVGDLGIRTLLLGAEPGAGIPEVRRRLEDAYGSEVLDVGAGYGVSCNHPEYQGMHWIADDHCLYELVDPATFEPVTLTDGATGLACFTPLLPEAGLFFHHLRVSMNDVHQVSTEPCPCGRSGFRYRIVGRGDDMLKVKGVSVYPAAIQGVINGFVPRVTGAFRIVLTERPPMVSPPLKLKVEAGEAVAEGDLPDLEREIVEKMRAVAEIRPAITWLPPNTLERATKKTQLLEKRYE